MSWPLSRIRMVLNIFGRVMLSIGVAKPQFSFLSVVRFEWYNHVSPSRCWEDPSPRAGSQEKLWAGRANRRSGDFWDRRYGRNVSAISLPFRLEISYQLLGKTIQVTYRVHHLGEEGVMPFFVGGHPGFNCPLMADEGFEDYYLEFEQEETCSIPKSYPETGLLNVFDRTPFLQQEKS